MKNKVLLASLFVLTLANTLVVIRGTAQESPSSQSEILVSSFETNNEMTRLSIGVSLDTNQILLLQEIFDVNSELISTAVITDGNSVNLYLEDGSNESTDIYSSAKVEFKNPGYGVQVNILTPENISSVTESMYQNAAIAAGALNADIQIASVVPVTGEGALAGVYEIFSQSGIELNSQDIRNAERQIQIEQLLLEQTNLSEAEISRLITMINLSVVEALENSNEIPEEKITELVEDILVDLGYDLTDDAKSALIQSAHNFSQSDVAKDPETKKALEQTLSNYEQLSDAYSQRFELDNYYFKIDNAKILSPEHEDNVTQNYLIAIYYTFELKEGEEPITASNAWRNSVRMIQETPNTINQLVSANVPGTDYLSRSNDLVKPGGIVQMSISASLEDTDLPIEIQFYNDARNDKFPLYSVDLDLSLVERE